MAIKLEKYPLKRKQLFLTNRNRTRKDVYPPHENVYLLFYQWSFTLITQIFLLR